MASLIESVRRLHGPKLIEHENGYDVDVICAECTRLRTETLDQAISDVEDWSYGVEATHVPYPCSTRVVAGTTSAEGKDESARIRLDHLVTQRDELEERMERIDAVIGLICRDLGESTDANDDTDEADTKPAKTKGSRSIDTDSDTVAEDEHKGEGAGSDSSETDTDPADDFAF